MSFTSRWSDVYLLAGARGVSVCGDLLATTTLVLVLQEAGHGGVAVSALMVAGTLPVALLATVGGRIADRVDSRRVLVIAGLCQALVCLVLAAAGTSRPLLVVGLVALLACGLAIAGPTMGALLPEMVRDEDLARASGHYQTAGVLGMMAGPALAGILVGLTGARVPLLIDAITFLALVVAGLALRTRRNGGAAAREQAPASYRVRDDRTLVVMIVGLAAFVGAVNSVNVFIVFLVRETLNASTTVFGLVEAAWAGGMLIGALLSARVPRQRMTVPALFAVVVVSCVPLIVGAAAPDAAWLIPLWVVGGVTNAATNVFLMVIVAGRAPANARGRAFGVVGSVVQSAGLIGLAVAGPLADHFDPRWLVAGCGILGMVVSGACLAAVRRETPQAGVDPEQARDSVGA